MAASPQLEDGFLLLAHELDAAISCAGFGVWESIVLRFVRDQIYGLAKLKAARLSPTDIAEQTGGTRSNVSRAIGNLVASNVLIKQADGLYKFVKDYESWTRNGRARLTSAMIDFARRSRPKKSRNSYAVVIANDNKPKAATLSRKTTSVIPSDNKNAAPYRIGRDEEFNKDDDETIRLRGTKTNTPDAKVDPRPNAVLPSRPDGVGAVHAPDTAAKEADELAAVIQATCPEIAAKLTPRLRSLTLAYPVDAIRQAIPEAFCRDLRGGDDARVSYLLTTLRQWQADPTARTRPKPVTEVKPKTYAKPAPKKNPADYDPYAKPTPETLATLAKLRQMVYDARA